MMLLGIRTVIYKVTDLEKAKSWYSSVLGIAPYFDQPFYVGFNVGGYELGLDPSSENRKPGLGGSTAYWGVEDLAATLSLLTKQGVDILIPLQEVGDGIKVACLQDPFGNEIGLIENPHFKLS
jgi:predicted enzyme related to lactoylglutathione lyase